jgi:hypothetical protein
VAKKTITPILIVSSFYERASDIVAGRGAGGTGKVPAAGVGDELVHHVEAREVFKNGNEAPSACAETAAKASAVSATAAVALQFIRGMSFPDEDRRSCASNPRVDANANNEVALHFCPGACRTSAQR